jgi:hypothetical protein
LYLSTIIKIYFDSIDFTLHIVSDVQKNRFWKKLFEIAFHFKEKNDFFKKIILKKSETNTNKIK